MKLRTKFAAAALITAALAGGGSAIAEAATSTPPRGTFESITNKGVTIFGNCANTNQTTTTYFYWSKKNHTWVQYVKPRVSTLSTWVCHK